MHHPDATVQIDTAKAVGLLSYNALRLGVVIQLPKRSWGTGATPCSPYGRVVPLAAVQAGFEVGAKFEKFWFEIISLP